MIIRHAAGGEDFNGGTITEALHIDLDIDEVGLIIELVAGQTANAFEVNSNGGSGGDEFRITKAGITSVGGQLTAHKLLASANPVQCSWSNPGTTGAFIYTVTIINTQGQTIFKASPIFNQSSGSAINNIVSITPTYNQTGTQTNTDLLINRTETSVGSGTQLLANFQVGGTSQCNIDTAGDILNTNGVYGTISDVKLKENILEGTDKLLGLLKLKVRSYNFKDNPKLKLLGFVAQEMEETFPGLVAEVPDYEKVLDSNWIPKPAKISQKLLTVKSQKTVIKTIDTYDSINDRYIRTSVDEIVDYDEPVVDIFDVYDEEGIKIDTKTIPVMEDYEEEPAETEADRPYITVPTGTTTKHIKTSVLIPMLVKALQEHIYISHASWLNTKQSKIDSFIDTIFANPFTFK